MTGRPRMSTGQVPRARGRDAAAALGGAGRARRGRGRDVPVGGGRDKRQPDGLPAPLGPLPCSPQPRTLNTPYSTPY
jgi:hypothetical protein